jgi:malate dehydrogenase
MKRVSIVGSGNVGGNTAFFLAENGTASVTLIDVKTGLPKGKALDMMEAGPLRGYDTGIDGADDIAAAAGSDVVVLAAGRVRRPGEDRLDLYHDNAAIVRNACEEVRRLAPQAVVVNLVEPIDSITLLAQETLGFDRFRVLGIGGLLTSTRIRHLVAQALGVSPRETTALVIGPHRRSMVVLRSTIRVSGIPAAKLLGEERLDALIEEARRAGDTILELAQASTSFYAPSAAAVSLIEAIVRDTRAILPVSVRLQGEYGVKGLCVGVPARIAAGGVERILELRLGDAERRAFGKAVAELEESVARKRRQPAGR